MQDLRQRFLEKRRRNAVGKAKEPTPLRVAIWILQDDADKGQASVRRAAAEFVFEMAKRRGVASKALNIW